MIDRWSSFHARQYGAEIELDRQRKVEVHEENKNLESIISQGRERE